MVPTLEQMGQDQVSGGVSVLCWLAAPVAMFYGNKVLNDISCLPLLGSIVGPLNT